MLAVKSGKVMDSSYYIGRLDNSQEYQATVKTPDGPKEKTCSNWNEAIAWVNGIINEEKSRNEIERDKG